MYPPFPSRPLLHWDCSTTLDLGCPRNRWPIRQSNIMERTDAKKKVPFICTHNAAWSQMAEGFLQALRRYIVTATKHTVQALSPPDYIRVLSKWCERWTLTFRRCYTSYQKETFCTYTLHILRALLQKAHCNCKNVWSTKNITTN
jgi:hypothetical protein